MALVVYDRVQETTATTGTGTITLGGAVAGYQSFAVVGNGNTTFYCIVNNAAWEVGIGTYSTTGPTLTRTTVLSNSNGNTSPITLVGTSSVFVTYPAGKSVNLDASGNVGPLGTITSGVWNGTTIGVAYGGTGVTASSGANSVMLRDANQNVAVNRLNQSNTSTTASGGTTVLTAASSYSQTLNGTGNQTFTMPDATTLTTGVAFVFNNNATGTLTLQDYAAGSIGTITSGGAVELVLLANGTVGGTWDVHGFLPEAVTWGTNALNLGSTVITGGTWNGGTITPAYGGTGLTTFTSANNALYSTGATTLTAGTLPILAGGTGQTTAVAAFNALNPMTTTGDIIYEASPTTAARLGIGSTGQVLTVAGGLPTWANNPSASTLNITDFTATSGQTSFTVTYTVGLVEGVYRNGIKLGLADYTATSGTAVVLASGAVAGDLIQVVYFTSVSVSNVVNTFSAGTTGFTPSSATTGAVTLAGTLNVANGGTGLTSLTAGLIPYGNGTSALSSIAGLNFSSPTNAPANMLYSTGGMSVGTGAIAYPTQATGIGYESKGGTSNGRFMVQDGNGRLNQYWGAYTDSGGYKYITTGEPAARYLMSVNSTTGGVHAWYGAPSGTAGTALTWTQMGSMISGTGGSIWFSQRGTSSDFYQDSSGNLGIGTSSPNARLSLGQPVQNNVLYLYDGTAGAKYGFGIASSELRMYSGSGAATTFGNFDGTTYTERMRISSAGYVGIGTSAPNGLLNIGTNGSATATPLALLAYNSSGLGTALDSMTYISEFGGSTGNNLRLLFALRRTATGTDWTTSAWRIQPAVDTSFTAATSNRGYLEFGFGSAGAYTGVGLSGSGTTSPDLVVNSVGNIGIGTLSPSFRLQLGANSSVATATPETISLGGTYSSTAGSNGKIRVWTDGSAYMGFGVSASQLDYITTGAYAHVWYTNGTERMRITAGGAVGIGTSSPGNTLQVGGGAGDTRGVFWPNTAFAIGVANATGFAGWIGGSGVTDTMVFSSSGGTERFRIGPAGQLGIGGANYGTSGQVLTSGGSGAAPSWTTVSVTPAAVSDQANSSTGYFDLPAGTTAQRPASPATGMVRFNTSNTEFEFYNGTNWQAVLSQGAGAYSTDILLVAGGGGSSGDWGGGGGGGGYLSTTATAVPSTAYSIVVGAGGTAGGSNSVPGNTGGNSSGLGLTAIGGGGGGADGSGGDAGTSGGSGGGGAIDGSGGSGTSGQGFAGANGNRGNSLQGGGGGGASGGGGNGQAGFNGLTWFNGSTYSGGGGGARNGSTASGGTGGGGTGANGGSGGTAGTANTGGGAGAQNTAGLNGGSGIVIIRYLGATRGSGGTITSAGGYTYHTFTTSGTYTG